MAWRKVHHALAEILDEIDWRGVRAIGSVLRHEYHSTSAKVIWDVARDDFPLLKRAVEQIMAALKE